jgi:hypothetical protein
MTHQVAELLLYKVLQIISVVVDIKGSQPTGLYFPI